jgi:hypothetical protein
VSADVSHGLQCVCVECMRRQFPNDSRHSEGRLLQAALTAERRRSDGVQRLDTYQRRLLNTFTKRWNADRERRGLSPVLAHDALTQGLESLIAMIGQE